MYVWLRCSSACFRFCTGTSRSNSLFLSVVLFDIITCPMLEGRCVYLSLTPHQTGVRLLFHCLRSCSFKACTYILFFKRKMLERRVIKIMGLNYQALSPVIIGYNGVTLTLRFPFQASFLNFWGNTDPVAHPLCLTADRT